MKRILITGITGFVGSNLVEFLKSEPSVQLFGFSRNPKEAVGRIPNIDFIPRISAEVLDRYMIDTMIHLAGIAHDLSGKFAKEDYERVNYRWTTEVFDAFSKANCKRFVFVSSIKAIVDHSDREIDEETKPRPLSDYGISKRNAEEYLSNHKRNHQQVYILRPCLIHGPGNKGNLNLLYRFVKSGLPYPLAAFDNRRSFLSIENFCFVVNSIVKEKLEEGAYLIADDELISTLELVQLIGEIKGKRVRLLNIPTGIIKGLAKLGSWLHVPFNKSTLVKLTENMMVSNRKLSVNLGSKLPVSAREGLIRTIKSFDE